MTAEDGLALAKERAPRYAHGRRLDAGAASAMILESVRAILATTTMTRRHRASSIRVCRRRTAP